MVERKLYKTKLCVLYQRGHCPRQSCSFAHGDAELRRSFNGRRDYHGSDLREKLDRRHSPMHGYSPERDARARPESHEDSPRSLGKMRKHRKKQNLDGQSDFSGSLRFSESAEDKDSRRPSSESKSFLDEQLRKLQSEISMLDDHKCTLEIYLEERIQEANSQTSRIQDLEMQLSQEKEESKRITSKIKKFIKAYNRQFRLEDELKRSRVQLQNVGEQLMLDTSRAGVDEEESGLNNMSNGESAGDDIRSCRMELLKNASPSNKRPRAHLEGKEVSDQAAKPTKGEGVLPGKIRLDKLSRWTAQSNTNNNNKAKGNSNEKNVLGHLLEESNLKRARYASNDITLSDKSRASESGFLLPSTSIAAHAIDEIVDIVETEEKFEANGTASGTENKVAFKIPVLPFPPPPPPPVPENAYALNKGDDENVDIDGIEEEMVDIV